MDASDIDSDLWHAIAGSSTRIPFVNSDVYYFPRGHLENSSVNRKIIDTCPPILCKVLSIRYHCTHSYDQAYVKFTLLPIHQATRNNGSNEKTDQTDIIYFSKILTPSDANNGGGFSVPRFCAELIFPRLNFSDDPPVQTLNMFDAHHNMYEFRHIYRGTPRRHLLTTGWSKFVNGKMLVAGDLVIFMKKKSTRQLFIGARRLRFAGDEGFSLDRFREGIESARRGEVFEVAYYPRMGMPNFVVRAEDVDESMRRKWNAGMRVKMVVETEDSSRMAWFQGTIESVGSVEDNGWPWGMIQVSWDEPEILQIPVRVRVSPWEVEPTEEEEPHSPFYLSSKKRKAIPNEEEEEDDDFSFPKLSTHYPRTSHLSVRMKGTTSLDPTTPDGNPFRSFTQLLKTGLGTTESRVFFQNSLIYKNIYQNNLLSNLITNLASWCDMECHMDFVQLLLFNCGILHLINAIIFALYHLLGITVTVPYSSHLNYMSFYPISTFVKYMSF